MLYVTRVVALPNVCQPGRGSWALLFFLGALSCARSGLEPGELDATEGPDLGGSGGSTVTTTGGTPQTDGGIPPVAQAGSVTTPSPPPCVPGPETCNGRDDDCDGAVDDVPAEACPGGGARFCIAGRMSECPRRCDVCVAGSVRICQNPFCSFWGEQECAADGQGFGPCRESKPPSECASVAKTHEKSRELQQCCLDNGYCCLDEFDLDQDGNRREMLGACGDVTCQ